MLLVTDDGSVISYVTLVRLLDLFDFKLGNDNNNIYIKGLWGQW